MNYLPQKELDIYAKKILEDASKKLLANLVIEDYEITILKGE